MITRRRIYKWTAPIAAMAAATMVLAACGGSSSPSKSSVGSNSGGQHLKVGTSADFPPMSYKTDSGQIDGFENDMLKYLTGRLGDTFSWQQLDFNGLIPALQSHRLDAIVSGMYDTPERRQVVDFVDYMKIPLAVMGLKSNLSNLRNPSDLCGKSVAYLVGSPPETTQLTQWSQQCKSQGKSAIKQVGYQSVAEAVANITNGRTDAELEGDIVVLYIANTKYGSKLGVGFDVAGGTSTIGMAVKKNSPLLPTLKQATSAYIASPQYCADAKKWQLTAGDLMRSC